MKTKENIFIIKGRLIDGCHDTCIEKGAVAVEGERIVYAGEERGCPLSGYPVYEAENEIGRASCRERVLWHV